MESQIMNDVSPILIYGAPKTGTTLFKSLLDGTDSIYVYPNEIKFKQYAVVSYKSLEELVLQYKTKNRDPLKIPDQRKMRLKLGQPWDVNKREGHFQGVGNLTKLFDIREYYTHFNRSITEGGECPNGAQLIFQDVLAAAKATQNISLSKLKYVCFKDVGGDFPKVVTIFLNSFPNGKIILIKRNPYAQFLSRLNFWKKYNSSRSGILSQILSLSRLNFFYKTLAKYPKKHPRMYTIAYEDLVSNTTHIMKNVANFLGVEYNVIFEYPTVFGMKTQVSTATEKKREVFKESLNKWETQLTGSQIRLVAACTPDASCHGYKHAVSYNWMWARFLSSSCLRKSLEFSMPRLTYVRNQLKKGNGKQRG